MKENSIRLHVLCVYTFMRVQVAVCAHMFRQTHMEVKEQPRVLLLNLCLLFCVCLFCLETGPLPGLEVTKEAKRAGQQLSLLPQCWDSKCPPTHSAFFVCLLFVYFLGVELRQDLCVFKSSLLLTQLSLQLPYDYVFLKKNIKL